MMQRLYILFATTLLLLLMPAIGCDDTGSTGSPRGSVNTGGVPSGGSPTPATTFGSGATNGAMPGGTGEGVSPPQPAVEQTTANPGGTPATEPSASPATQPSSQSTAPLPEPGNTASGAPGLSYPHPKWDNGGVGGSAGLNSGGQTGGSSQVGAPASGAGGNGSTGTDGG